MAVTVKQQVPLCPSQALDPVPGNTASAPPPSLSPYLPLGVAPRSRSYSGSRVMLEPFYPLISTQVSLLVLIAWVGERLVPLVYGRGEET